MEQLDGIDSGDGMEVVTTGRRKLFIDIALLVMAGLLIFIGVGLWRLEDRLEAQFHGLATEVSNEVSTVLVRVDEADDTVRALGLRVADVDSRIMTITSMVSGLRDGVLRLEGREDGWAEVLAELEELKLLVASLNVTADAQS